MGKGIGAMKSGVWRAIAAVAVVALAVIIYLVAQGDAGQPTPVSSTTSESTPIASTTSTPANTDALLHQLFESQQSNVQVQGQGTVTKLLADDNEGSRHQRFILQLASGQTLLVAHNIDIAPRLDGLAVGDTVGFYGEYIYSDQGGTIHWTHHDPSGKHVAGWLTWQGKKYQ